jgi:dihydroxy-acid dehydratase
MAKTKKPQGIDGNLTSYGDVEFSKYIRRAFLASAGFDAVDLSRPIVGIVDTSSDYNTCHRQMPEMVAAVKRGVLEAGGLPLAFPTISLHEILTSPTTMLFRNLAAMDTEEMIRAQPMDAVVLLSGCDKTLPAQIMAALSADIPAVSVVAGPMLTGMWRGQRLGACTDCRRLWASYRAGELTSTEIAEIERNLSLTGGTCMVMGTASTMACLVETLGLMLPGGAAIPHAAGQRLAHAAAAGRRAVAMIREGLTPSRVLSKGSFSNALVVLAALAGSTNAVIHLLAVARRAGIKLSLGEFDEAARRVPLLVDVKPAGSGYLEDFYHAGGMPVLLKTLGPFLDLEAHTIAGTSLGELLQDVAGPGTWQTTIRGLGDPLRPAQDPGAIAVLRGTLAPEGAVMKAAAASPGLFSHRGPAVVFESTQDAAERIDDPALGITPDHVMVLRNAGPVGAGMPEAGSLPIPKHLAARGVKDMVRVSDARMSGTAYGTVVLHVSPEAAVGGPLALVKDGDIIELCVSERRIDLVVDENELAARRAGWKPPTPPARGYRRLFFDHVLSASQGCDFDFL